MMQCKEACSVPLLTHKPCQPSPLNSSIFNYVIFRNKVQSQFTNNLFLPKKERKKKDLAISNSQRKKKKRQLSTRLQCKIKPLFQGKS